MSVHIIWIRFKDHLGPVFRFVGMPGGKLQLTQIQLRLPVFRLKLNRPLKLAVCCSPALHLDVGLCQLEMRFPKSWIQLQGTPVVNQCVGIFPLIKTLVTFREELFGITIAACSQQRGEQH